MKNIHVLPTDKPRFDKYLILNKESKLCIWNTNTMGSQKTLPTQHIYITSDEEIKEGDRVYYSGQQLDFPIGIYKTLDNVKEQMSAPSVGGIGIRHRISEELMENGKKKIRGAYLKIGYNIFQGEHLKKIILTTDPDLIADGVQSIDDEFLEWFVKNPTCEWIEVVDELNMNGKNGLDRARFIYKIIIPQEEPKQELDCPYDFTSRCTMGRCDCKPKQEKPCTQNVVDEAMKIASKDVRQPKCVRDGLVQKQETLEEAAEIAYQFEADPNFPDETEHKNFVRIFKKGAKWQSERIYSEEESIQKIIDYVDFQFNTDGELNSEIKKWFEQFKKK
jgi:hypothetical protein